MRAAIFRNGDFVVDDIKDPTPSEGQVLVKSLSYGICGSEGATMGMVGSGSHASTLDWSPRLIATILQYA